MQNDFKQVLKEVTDVCKFEHWLRFYFTQEKDENLFLDIPENIVEHIKKEYPNLSGLADKINQEIITPEKSQNWIIGFISQNLDRKKYDDNPSLIPRILNSKSFEVEITAFHLWVNAHEDQLEEKVMDFKEWMELFEAWKRTERGQDILGQLHSTSVPHSSSQ